MQYFLALRQLVHAVTGGVKRLTGGVKRLKCPQSGQSSPLNLLQSLNHTTGNLFAVRCSFTVSIESSPLCSPAHISRKLLPDLIHRRPVQSCPSHDWWQGCPISFASVRRFGLLTYDSGDWRVITVRKEGEVFSVYILTIPGPFVLGLIIADLLFRLYLSSFVACKCDLRVHVLCCLSLQVSAHPISSALCCGCSCIEAVS